MKKILVVLLTFFSVQGYAQNRAAITFLNSDNTYDFGGISQGDAPLYQMEIKNTGTEPLVISEIKCENGDLRFQLPKRSLKPGKKGLIVVMFSAKDPSVTGSFKNDVFITSNATDKPYPFIHVSGTVIPSKGDSGSGSKSGVKQSGRGGRSKFN